MYHPTFDEFPEDKGQKGGHCNRSMCLLPGANWFNHSTQKWYCIGCACLIIEANPEFRREMGIAICTLGNEISG